MAYQFRKLCQKFKYIPSSKTVGFTTRAGDGDQGKNGNVDIISGALSIMQNKSLLTYSDAPTIFNSLAVLRSKSESDLQTLLVLPRSPQNFQKDIAEILQLGQSQTLLLMSAQDASWHLQAKSVSPTSDDILFSPSHEVDEDIGGVREKVNVDILTQSHYQNRLASHGNDYPLEISSFVLNNAVVSSDVERGCRQKDHLCCNCSSNKGFNAPKGQGKHGPTPSQLHDIKEKLEDLVHQLFKGQHNYSILNDNVVMENNLFGHNRTTVGLSAYKLELFKLRMHIRAKFSNTSMQILNITTLEQTGIIRIHWRLKGLPHSQLLKFIKLLTSKKSAGKEDFDWLEAFSYFHIGKDGKVYKHRLDRMIADDEGEPDRLTEKLRGFLNPAKPLVS